MIHRFSLGESPPWRKIKRFPMKSPTISWISSSLSCFQHIRLIKSDDFVDYNSQNEYLSIRVHISPNSLITITDKFMHALILSFLGFPFQNPTLMFIYSEFLTPTSLYIGSLFGDCRSILPSANMQYHRIEHFWEKQRVRLLGFRFVISIKWINNAL